MRKKWDAKCDSTPSYLWLRNGIFYYRVELPRINGKRRYFRVSLKTGNYYEAMTIIKSTKIRMKGENPDFKQIHDELKYFHDLLANPSEQLKSSIHIAKMARTQQEQFEQLSAEYEKLKKIPEQKRTEYEKETLAKLDFIINNQVLQPVKAPAPLRTISEVIETMLLKGNNCLSEQVRKRNTITKLLATVSLKVEDDYSKFHTSSTIDAISRYIVAQTDTKGDMKRKLIRYIKELATCGTNIDPDNYKSNVILNLPKVEKTKKAEKKPHLPYTEAQLLKIFDPKHDYFKENPDAFFVCLIALFTGARANSAVTIQYNDIIIKEGIPCIHFIENHPIKQLKNEASERIVPIHPQLLEVGFVDYVRRNEKLLKAEGTDFIFPRCQTKNGLYNNKYMVRYVLDFFKNIGVKTGSNDGLDFHSFRKNASIALQEARIIPSYINDIIGWDGKGTMEKSYSNHTLAQINAEMDKFSYDFLTPHFAKWKVILAKK